MGYLIWVTQARIETIEQDRESNAQHEPREQTDHNELHSATAHRAVCRSCTVEYSDVWNCGDGCEASFFKALAQVAMQSFRDLDITAQPCLLDHARRNLLKISGCGIDPTVQDVCPRTHLTEQGAS